MTKEETLIIADEYGLRDEVTKSMDAGLSPIDALREWDIYDDAVPIILQREYLYTLFGVKGGLWSQTHTNFSPLMFCEANRKAFIAEYLLWEEFVEEAKANDISYYYGIDLFLKEYRKAVYNCLL